MTPELHLKVLKWYGWPEALGNHQARPAYMVCSSNKAWRLEIAGQAGSSDSPGWINAKISLIYVRLKVDHDEWSGKVLDTGHGVDRVKLGEWNRLGCQDVQSGPTITSRVMVSRWPGTH